MPSLEDIILQRDNRGISALRHLMEPSYLESTGRFVLDNKGLVVIVTGFFIVGAQASETDGPPGAVALGNVLSSLGCSGKYVTDSCSFDIVNGLSDKQHEVIEFPILSDIESEKFAGDLIRKMMPSLLISIERCGPSEDGKARNMRNVDITEFNAKTDYLFKDQIPSIGIGDGGNEIGMGNLRKAITSVPSLVEYPCVTEVSKLVIASVSNWGAYGLITAISRCLDENLLPSIKEEQRLVQKSVDLGAVDGFTGQKLPMVDGFTMEQNSQTLRDLHDALKI